MLQLTSGTTFASSGSPNHQHALLANLQGYPIVSDLSGALNALQNNGTVLQLLPHCSVTCSSPDAMPLVLQLPGPADQSMHMLPERTTLSCGMQLVDAVPTFGMQPLQQGCVTQGHLQEPAQQVMLVDGSSHLAACASADDSNIMQLKSQNAAVQQLLLSTPASAPQGLVLVAGANMVSRLEH